MRWALDSGILLRWLHRSDPQHHDIRRAVRQLRARGDHLAVATQNIAEFWNVCTRPVSSRGGYAFSIQEADRRLRVLERLVAILDDTPAAFLLWRQMVR